jgi:hypothetical protein
VFRAVRFFWRERFKNLGDGTDGVGMPNTPRHTGPTHTSSHRAPAGVLTASGAAVDVQLSPRVVALRKLVAAGQYQVSARYLAHKIIRSAGFKLD